ncbi:MAG: hypothetical protein WBB48_00600 [Thermodesulfobacteriota bacterium]
MKMKSLFLLLILAIALPISAFAQDPKTPAQEPAKESSADAKTDTKKAKEKELDLDQVLAKYYESVGGLERWQKLNTMVMKGTITSQEKSMPITAYHLRPNKCRVEFIVKEVMMAQIFNGVFAWQINPLSGNPEPAPMTRGKTNYMKDTCGIENSLIDYKKKGYDVELIGSEEIESKKNYKIRVKYRSGNLETYYINAETFLITKTTGIYDFDGRETRITTNYKNYKETKGFMVPYLLAVDIHGAPGQEMLNIDEFTFNAKIDPKIFEFPKEKMIDLQKKK